MAVPTAQQENRFRNGIETHLMTTPHAGSGFCLFQQLPQRMVLLFRNVRIQVSICEFIESILCVTAYTIRATLVTDGQLTLYSVLDERFTSFEVALRHQQFEELRENGILQFNFGQAHQFVEDRSIIEQAEVF